MRYRHVITVFAGLALLSSLVMAPPVAAVGPGAVTVPTIAYADGDGAIHLADVDGTNDRVVLPEVLGATTETHFLSPALSPDGTQLVAGRDVMDFAKQREYGGLVRLNLTTGARIASALTLNSIPENVRWSRDGALVYYSLWDWTTNATSLWRWPALAGGTAVRLATGTELADISPSGQQLLVFAGVTSSSSGVLAVRDLATGAVSPVSGATGTWWAAWSPDGGRLALLSPYGTAMKLTTIAARGSTPVVVTTSLPKAYSPTWTPDGTGVIVDLQNTIERVDIATGARTVLVSVPDYGPMGHTVWSATPATDATVPAAPVLTKLTRSTTGVSVTWTNPADSDWSRTVVRNGTTVLAAGRTTTATFTLPVTSASDISVTAYDGYGNASGPAKAVTAGVVAPAVSSSVTATAPFPVRWSAPGATAYTVRWTVQTLTSAGWKLQPWKTWLTGTTATSATFGAGNLPTRVVPGTTYYVVVTPTVGALTASTVTSTVVPFDQTATSGSSGWTTVRGSSYFLGSAYVTKLAGKYRSLATYGSTFSVIGSKCATCGAFRVYVDGKLVRTVDTYSATTKARQVLWSANLGAIKRHAIKIVTVGTAHRPAVFVDAIGAKR
jgi:hypothetical protein